MLIMMVGWLNVPTPPQEIEVLELFAGTGRLCRLAKACAIPSQAHDLLYDKHERSSMVAAPAAMPAPPLPKGDDEFLEVSSGDQRALAKASPDDAVVPTRPPPPKLTRGAIKKRLWRLVQPKASGKFKVPKEVVDEYRDERTRGRVEALFEKSGYQREVFIQKVRRIYESVNETSLESNYEFLSEDDMKELGWSERTRRDIVQELVEEELGDGPTMKKLDGKIRKVDPEFAMFDDDEMMEGQPDEEVSESSDGLEEAAAETQQEVLKQVKFPEVEKDKLLEKVCELTKNLSTADEQMGQIYTAGVVNGFTKEFHGFICLSNPDSFLALFVKDFRLRSALKSLGKTSAKSAENRSAAKGKAKVKRLGLLRNSLQNHLAMELGTKRVTGVDTKLALTAVSAKPGCERDRDKRKANAERYKALARRTMTLQIGGYRLKPKFHGLHHVAQFVKDALQRGDMQKLEHMLGCPVAGANLLDFLPAKEDQARWAILSVP
ncbi:unnamed protein product [Durusdinium trenchii]|uniref:Uncharacterized protein n=1 Tax=Durusdinium trenchii TaxID=1381693 RepID=A0ABP0M514_9DINO